MKRLLFKSTLFAAFAFIATGCLKDKGFENHEYGINDPDDSPAGVGFALGSKSSNIVGIEVSANPQNITTEPVVVLFNGEPASSDINVTFTLNPALVDAYNTATNGDVEHLPTNILSMPNMSIVIPAGERKATLPLAITNSTTLDPTKAYGLGITITSTDDGYTIAENFKNLLLIFNIKNKYDGIYRLSGYHNRPTLDAPYKNVTVHMITTGPNKVKMFWPALGADAHPINGGTTYYGSFTSEFAFDLSSNPINPLLSVDNPYTPGSPPMEVLAGSNSRWEQIGSTNTGNIYAAWYYNGNPTQRGFFDTLIYVGPR